MCKDVLDWYWCELCDCACIKCTICGSVSCSGHSEECCYELFERIIKLNPSLKRENFPENRIIPNEMSLL